MRRSSSVAFGGVDRGVELIGLLPPPVDDGVDLGERLGQAALSERRSRSTTEPPAGTSKR